MTTIKKEEKIQDLKIPAIVENSQTKQADKEGAYTSNSSKRKRDVLLEPEVKKESKKASVAEAATAVVVKPETTTTAAAAAVAAIAAQDEDQNGLETPKVIPMNKDSYFYCRRCNENIKGCREYYSHIKAAHNIKPNITGIKHLDLQPDVDDPTFYCRSCEKSHANKNLFNFHLRRYHHMLLKPLEQPEIPKPLPDPFNPDYYCTVCKKAYSKSSFKRHLLLKHKIDLNSVEQSL